MEPVVVSLSEQYESDILFFLVDVFEKEGWELGRSLGVRYHPSYMLYDAAGKRVGQWFGTFREADLKAHIEHALSRP